MDWDAAGYWTPRGSIYAPRLLSQKYAQKGARHSPCRTEAMDPGQPVRAFYDLETTGFGRGARIVQIAVILHFSQTEDDERDRPLPNREFCALVDPSPVRMDPRASDATGLTNAMLSGAPPFAEVWADLCAFMSTQIACRVETASAHVTWTGYNNAAFDDKVLAGELARVGQGFPARLGEEISATHSSCDLFAGVKASREYTLRGVASMKLCDVYAFHADDAPFPVNERNGRAAHDALSDARATRFVWLRTEPTVRKACARGAMRVAR